MPPDQGQRRSGILSDCSANRRVPARSLAIRRQANQADRRLMTPPDPASTLGREVIEDADALRDVVVLAKLLGTSAYVRDLRFLFGETGPVHPTPEGSSTGVVPIGLCAHTSRSERRHGLLQALTRAALTRHCPLQLCRCCHSSPRVLSDAAGSVSGNGLAVLARPRPPRQHPTHGNALHPTPSPTASVRGDRRACVPDAGLDGWQVAPSR